MDLSQLKLKIIQNIDHPYFQNNESFIEMFDTVYKEEKDIKILLLMYNKNISFLYHYLYLELCDYYCDKNKELCKYLLEKALKRKVYDREKILMEYKKYENIQITKSENEFYRILHPKRLTLWGKNWIIQDKIYINTSFKLEDKYASIAEFAIHRISEKQNTKENIEPNSDHSFSLHLERSELKGNYVPRNSEIELANFKSHELFNNTMFDNTKIDETFRKSINQKDTMADIISFHDLIEIDKFANIGNISYCIRGLLRNDIFTAKRIANSDKEINMAIEEFCIQKVNIQDFVSFQKYDFDFIPRIFVKCANVYSQYIIYPNDNFTSLKIIFKLLVKEYGIVDETIVAYFYLQLSRILNVLIDQKIYTNELILEDFLVSRKYTLTLCKYDQDNLNSNLGILSTILKITKLSKYKYLVKVNKESYFRLEKDLKLVDLEKCVFSKINALM